jgi:hypothetical protein
LELLHHRLGHHKCRTLLAANKHNLWDDTTIRMTGETGCLTCGIATIRLHACNKEAHSRDTCAGEYLFLDIQHPLVTAGLTVSTSYAFYLLIVLIQDMLNSMGYRRNLRQPWWRLYENTKPTTPLLDRMVI